jgi:hypothetical protein
MQSKNESNSFQQIVSLTNQASLSLKGKTNRGNSEGFDLETAYKALIGSYIRPEESMIPIIEKSDEHALECSS